MNQNLKQHQVFLEGLKYYDPANFITKPHNIKTKTISNLQKTQNKWPNQKNSNDLSEIYSMHYTKQFNEIKQFIQSQTSNVPLLIKGAKHSGKKTTLCQIIQQYKKTPQMIKNKIFIPNFSSVNKVYSEILYNIMVKLRINFAINQKVQVNQQKIRRYFKYWLDITSENIQKNNLGCHKSQKQTLIIIIDGIDQLTDSRGQMVFPQFWLPQKIPKNIKLILSGTANQNVIERLSETNNVKVINFQQKNISQRLRKQLNPQIQSLLLNRNLSFFQIKVLNGFIQLNNQFKVNSQDTLYQILQNYIQKASSQTLSVNQIKSLILCLSLSKKGLTQVQLQNIMKMKPNSIDQFLTKFQPLIQNYNEYYIVLNSEVKNFIIQNYDPKNQKKQLYHEAIAKILKRDQMSIRKLQEEIHHLSMAGKNFQIKQVIAAIQNFLILYTPPCKYILSSAWKKMQQTLNSDPVFEYNKSVQSFLAHYHPKEEQLYKIIYQLSMFFREYSDFQGAKIPVFRHPLLKGQQEQLNQISVYEQLKQLKMTASIKQFEKKKLQQTFKAKSSDKQNSVQKQKQKVKSTKSSRKDRKSMNSQIQLATHSQKINRQIADQTESQNASNQVQKLNLQIKSNRQKFHQHYLSILQPYLKQYYVPIKKLYLNDTFIKQQTNNVSELDEQDEYEQNFIQLSNVFPNYNFDKVKSNLILKNLDQYFEQNYHRQQSTKYYYYKEWIWIQFPWICQAFNSDFSKMIEQNISKPTQYMSILQQFKFIKDVLKISQVSKQNKTAIYQRKKIQVHSIDLRKKIKSNKNMEDSMKISKRDQMKQSFLKKKSTVVKNNISDASPKNNQNTKNQNLNLAKYKLDISNITTVDQKLNEQKNKQMKIKQSYDSRFMSKVNSKINGNLSFMNNLEGTYLTQLNSSQVQNSNRLPYLNNDFKQSRFTKGNRDSLSQSMLKPFESYDNRVKRQQNQLNTLVNSNLKLKRQIQQMQKTSIMINSIDTISPYQQNLIKIQEMQNIKQKMLKRQQNQSKLRAKLQTIIKICDNNQSHQKQSQVLSNFLQNLKIMTKHQKINMETQLKTFMNYLDQYKIQFKQIKQRKQKLQNQLNQYQQTEYYQDQNCQNNQTPYIFTQRTQTQKSPKGENSQIVNNSNIPNDITNCTIKKNGKGTYVKNKSKHKKITSNNSKNQRIYSNQLYQQLARLFSVPLDQKINYQTLKKQNLSYDQIKETSKYLLEQFEQKIQKFADLQMNYQDIQYENDQLYSHFKDLQKSLHNNENEKAHSQQVNEEIKEKRKILKEIKNRIKQIQSCHHDYVQID